MSDPSPLPILKAEGRVLSTLESDGSRRWLTPRLAKGRFLARRQVVAYALIAIYAILPFLTINGRPAVQLDLWNARFALFGFEFRPTDLELLAVFGLMTFLSIFLATALFGRVWCGWACPQTVYMEHVFRPLERLFTGTAGRGGKPTKAVAGWRTPLMYLVFLLICWHLANTFLAYFVGVEALNRWIWSEPPWRHPGAFALVLFVTALMMFDFCYWREQLCIIGCPYGRFQSVLLDRSSLVVGYDTVRGEQRGRGKEREAKGLGDCVDCSMCVHVCPTGIDIRDGLQLECVNCTQCIDACDAVMDKIGRPRGLIRYSSQAAFEGGASKLVRPRVVIYVVVLVALAGLFGVLLASQSAFDVTLLRGLGRPFVVTPSGEVENIVRVKLVNRTDEPRVYRVEVLAPAGLRIDGLEQVELAAGDSATEPYHLLAPASAFAARGGTAEAVLRFHDDTGESIDTTYPLFGPANPVTTP